jgi:phage tail protein X
MPLAMFRGETSIDALAARLFQVRSGDSRAGRQATEALLRANPQLAKLEQVPPGSVIVVPDTTAAVNAGEIMQTAAFTLADSARLLNEQMAAFARALAAQSANAAAEADSTLKLLRDRSLAAAASKDEELAQRLNAISDNTKATLKDLQVQQTTLEQALAQLQEDVAKLTKASSPSAQPPPGGHGQPPPSPAAESAPARTSPPAPRRTARAKKKRK